MVLALPALPRTAEVTPIYVDFSARNTPPAGGASITILRPGRMAVSVQIPPLDSGCAQKWLAVLLAHKATGEPVNLVLPKPKDQVSVTGVSVNSGVPASQPGGGTALPIAGVAGTVVPVGALLSLGISPAVHFVHMVTGPADYVIPAGGALAIGVSPMLHVLPTQATPVEFNAPILQGNLDTGNVQWTLQRLRWIGVEFTLTEIF